MICLPIATFVIILVKLVVMALGIVWIWSAKMAKEDIETDSSIWGPFLLAGILFIAFSVFLPLNLPLTP